MNPASALASLRLAVGTLAWGTPRLGARLFRLDPDGNPQAPYLGRLFGVRDVALAAGTLAAGDREARRLWLRLGLACDAADAAAAVLAARGGYVSRFTGALLAAPALAAVGLGIAALRDSGGAERLG